MPSWADGDERRQQEWRDEGARKLARGPRGKVPVTTWTEGTMTTEIARLEPALPAERTVEELVAQASKIKAAMEQAMEVGHHYGIIPGAKKPSLWKPGAEKLTLLFRLDPQYESAPMGNDRGEGGHLTIKSTCTLWHIPTGQRFGSGVAICSTRESKYAYRYAKHVCPVCGKETVIKGKDEYGGGWICWKKEGKSDGCGAKFKDEDPRLAAQAVGRVANDDLADTYNTVEKMADKRALVAAVLNCTAASDVFTQDLEDFEPADVPPPAPVRTVSQPAPAEPDPVDEADPDLTEKLERSVVLARFEGAADKLKLDARARADLLVKHGVTDPRTADLSALEAMLEELRQLWRTRQLKRDG